MSSTAARPLPAARPDLTPVSPENLIDPVPLYRELQREEPIHWSEPLQAWLITRHDDVSACFRDPRLSSNRTELFVKHQLGGLGPERIPDFVRVNNQHMLMRDGAAHTRLRRQSNQGFTSQAIENWRPLIHRTVESLLDRVQAQGHMDVATDLSEPLPSLVMAELFAIPAEDRERFQAWSNPMATFFGATVGDVQAAALAANEATREMAQYLTHVIEARRRAPGQDVLSLILHAQEEGRMSADELVATAMLILVAGHVTTIDQLSNGVNDLLMHPDQLQRLRDDPGLLKSAVEEMLRFHPAVPFMHRVVAEDLELRGRTLRRGQLVFLGLAAANRDPAVFPDPDRFDVGRAPNPHRTFAFGPHLCLGAGLARRELEIATGALLRRMPGLRLDPDRAPRLKCNSLLFRGFDSLPIRW
jgi:cytochrome P450 PksS